MPNFIFEFTVSRFFQMKSKLLVTSIAQLFFQIFTVFWPSGFSENSRDFSEISGIRNCCEFRDFFFDSRDFYPRDLREIPRNINAKSLEIRNFFGILYLRDIQRIFYFRGRNFFRGLSRQKAKSDLLNQLSNFLRCLKMSHFCWKLSKFQGK